MNIFQGNNLYRLKQLSPSSELRYTNIVSVSELCNSLGGAIVFIGTSCSPENRLSRYNNYQTGFNNN